MIKMLRVDHRLLHGQVAVSWKSALDVDCILVANDSVPGDALRKSAIKLAKPADTKLVIKTIDDSIAAINSGKTDKYKLFIVVESIADAARLCRECGIKQLNLGGTKATAETPCHLQGHERHTDGGGDASRARFRGCGCRDPDGSRRCRRQGGARAVADPRATCREVPPL